MQSMKDQKVVVTGATGGIARATLRLIQGAVI